ncbi:MAG: SpaA isopeptide-forming pilin-related protein [Bacillota bacterium]|nr:SpaA isopeptide-forming pilin-related protein [Bacillota bacterium]
MAYPTLRDHSPPIDPRSPIPRRGTRRLRAVCALLLGLSLLFPQLALAIDWPETVHVIEADVHRAIYVKGSSTPMVNADLRIADGKGPDGKGTIFYCIDQSLNGANTRPTRESWQHVLNNNASAMRGLVALLDAGAPNVNGAGNWSASIQATRYAIWAWMNTCGFTSNTMTAAELMNGYEDNAAGKFAKSLYRIAEAGTTLLTGQLELSPQSPAWTVSGERVTTNVTVNGSFDRFSIQLPAAATATPTGGGPGTSVTLSMPIAAAATEQTFTFKAGTSSRSPARYGWYSGSGVTQDLVGHPGQELLITDTRSVTLAPPLARFRIEKQGDDGSRIQGASFDLRQNGTKIAQLETGADGTVQSGWFAPGSYEIVECHVPAPYVLDSTPYAFTLAASSGQEQRIVRTNRRQTGRLIVSKQSPDGIPIAGARFAILPEDGDNVLAEIESNSEGIATSDSLPLGRYRVRELSVPAPWLPDGTEQSFELAYAGMEAAEAIVNLTLVNGAARGRIRLEKRDQETGARSQGDATLAGAVYRIEDHGGQEVSRLTTDENGVALSPELPLGRYTVIEESPPPGYLLDPTPQSVELSYSNEKTAVVETVCQVRDRVLRGSVQINKSRRKSGGDGDSSLEALGGITFNLTLISDPEQTYKVESDANGIAVWENLPYDDYLLEEETPVWAKPSEPRTVHIPYGDRDGAVEQIDIINESYQARVRVVKVDQETGEAICQAGIRFRIIDLATGEPLRQTVHNPSAQSIEVWESDETGSVTLPEMLPYGQYRIEELSAPDGYVLSEEGLSFKIDETVRDGETVTLSFANRRIQGHIAISKHSRHDGRPLPAVTFVLTNEAGEEVARLVTDANGEATSELLPYGVYQITEAVPAGFIAAESQKTVTVRQDAETVRLELENEPTAVLIKKLDGGSGRALPGAVFRILNEDGEALTLLKEGGIWRPSAGREGTQEAVTDSDGELLIHELPFGSYRLLEANAPAGYCQEYREMAFSVDADSCASLPLLLELANEPTAVRIKKLDSSNGRALAGAVFRVLNEDGEALTFLKEAGVWRPSAAREATQEPVTDTDGELLIYGLPFGSYQLLEANAPAGYCQEKREFAFSVDTDSCASLPLLLEITNEPTAVNIKKCDADSGQALAGAVFKILNEDGESLTFLNEDGIWRPAAAAETAETAETAEAAEELITGSDGDLLIYGLPFGSYQLLEEMPPPGYRREEREFPFTVGTENSSSAALELGISNEALVVELSKQDITNAAGLPGATIRIATEDGTVVFEDITAADGTVRARCLEPGSYVFYEEYAPEGYLLSSDRLPFILHPDGRVESESVILYNRPTELVIRKETDDGEALAGVSFSIQDENDTTLSFRRDENGAWRPVAASRAAELQAHGIEVSSELVSDKDGLIRVLALARGQYRLQEVKTPAGFVAGVPLDFRIDPEMDEGSLSITVSNRRLPPPAALTKTGSGMPSPSERLLGLAFLLLATVLFFRLRSRAARDRAGRQSSPQWPHVPAADPQDR